MAQDGKVWAGFDLGGTKMLAVVYDDQFNDLGRERCKSKGFEGVKSGVGRMLDALRKALSDAGIAPGSLAGVGVAVPGPVNPRKGSVIEMPNLGWRNVPLGSVLSEALGCPVHILNDVDAGTYGEFRFGAGREGRCVLGVFPGTGIGGGCVYEGNLLQGAERTCLELGHIRVQPNGPFCGCGGRGCLEAVASRLAIAQAAAAAAYRGQAPALLAAAGTDLAKVRSGTLAKAIKDGDKAVEQIVQDAARWLGIGVAAVINLMNPDIVVLGGGLVEALPELYLKGVAAGARENEMRSFHDTYKIAVAKLGDDASVKGAAAWARHREAEAK